MDIDHNTKILEVLKKQGAEGATITEIIKTTKLTRDNVRIALAALEGANQIKERPVGKAKLYWIKEVGK